MSTSAPQTTDPSAEKREIKQPGSGRPDPMADRRKGNIVLALTLVAFVVFVFVISLLRLGGHGQ